MKWVFYKRFNCIFHPICELNANPTLSKNRFTRIKYGMLDGKPKVQTIVEGVKKRGILPRLGIWEGLTRCTANWQ